MSEVQGTPDALSSKRAAPSPDQIRATCSHLMSERKEELRQNTCVMGFVNANYQTHTHTHRNADSMHATVSETSTLVANERAVRLQKMYQRLCFFTLFIATVTVATASIVALRRRHEGGTASPNHPPSHPLVTVEWIEVTHTSYPSLDVCIHSTCTPNVIWFYMSPGSGVFVDVRNTIQFDELNIIGRTGLETPHRISESMVRLKKNDGTLRGALGLASEDVVGLRGIVRWNHNEFTFPTYRHEVMLFTNSRYNETSHLTDIVNETRLRCGSSGECSTNDLIRAGCNSMLTGSTCPQHDRLRIAFLGDSLTRGNALHEVTRRGPVHVEGRGNFPLRIQRATNFWHVMNFGHGGTTAQRDCESTAGAYADTATFDAAMVWAADIYVIMLGTNDAMSCWNAQGFSHDLMTVTSSVLNISRMGVYIVVPPPIHRDATKSSLIRREMVPAIRDVVNHIHTATKYVRMVDLQRECIDSHRNACFHERAFTEDGLHLNTIGSDQVADTIFRHLQSSP